MNIKEKILIRILFLVAKVVSEEKWHKDLSDLCNNISYSVDKA